MSAIIAPGGPGAKTIDSAVSLLQFDKGGVASINGPIYERVRVAKFRLAIVGIARTGKSSLVNMLCSMLAKKHIRPFASDAGTAKITVGITVAFIGNIAILDCQGIRQGDSSNDKILLLVCHFIADVFVYNQTALLDNTIFANLIQMAAFVALTEKGKSRPPHLVIRVRDLTGDDFDEKSELDKFLSLEYEDEYKTMRSAFAKLFRQVSVVTSDLIGKVETKTMGIDYPAFMKANPSFRSCVQNIIKMLTGSPSEELNDLPTLNAMLSEQCGLTVRDLDALSTGMELAMRRFIDGYRVPKYMDNICKGHNACALHINQRAIENKRILDSFDSQFSRVNELNYGEQRAVLYELLTGPMFTQWYVLWRRILTELGFIESIRENGERAYTIGETYTLQATRTTDCKFEVKTASSHLQRTSPGSLESRMHALCAELSPIGDTKTRRPKRDAHVQTPSTSSSDDGANVPSQSLSTAVLVDAIRTAYDQWAAKDPIPTEYTKTATDAFNEIDRIRKAAMNKRITQIITSKASWVGRFAASLESLLGLEHDEVGQVFKHDAIHTYPKDALCSYTITFTVKTGVNELICVPTVGEPVSASSLIGTFIPPSECTLPQDEATIKGLLAAERRTEYGKTLFYMIADLDCGEMNMFEHIRQFFGDAVIGVQLPEICGRPVVVVALQGTATAAALIKLVLDANLADLPNNDTITIVTATSLIARDRRNLINGECKLIRIREALADPAQFTLAEFSSA
jgi:hypothetical protein